MTSPVRYPAGSLQRKQTRAAISSGLPIRFMGIEAIGGFPDFFGERRGHIGFNKAGGNGIAGDSPARQFRATDLVRPIIPALAAE